VSQNLPLVGPLCPKIQEQVLQRAGIARTRDVESCRLMRWLRHDVHRTPAQKYLPEGIRFLVGSGGRNDGTGCRPYLRFHSSHRIPGDWGCQYS
jgi:hypothetical protein